MTLDELIAITCEQATGFTDPEGRCPTIEQLPKTRVLDAVVVYFETDAHDGNIEVFLERASGQFITATLVPHKPKPENEHIVELLCRNEPGDDDWVSCWAPVAPIRLPGPFGCLS